MAEEFRDCSVRLFQILGTRHSLDSGCCLEPRVCEVALNFHPLGFVQCWILGLTGHHQKSSMVLRFIFLILFSIFLMVIYRVEFAVDWASICSDFSPLDYFLNPPMELHVSQIYARRLVFMPIESNFQVNCRWYYCITNMSYYPDNGSSVNLFCY